MFAPSRSRRRYLRTFRALLLVSGALHALPADASELSQRHRAICRGDDRYRIELTGVARDPSTCARQNACFFYILTCPDGRRHSLRWYLNPQSLPHEEFYAEQYPVAQIVVIALLLIYTAVARGSGRRLKLPYFRTIWVPLSITAATLLVSNVPARYPPSNIAESLWVAAIELALLFVTYAGIPAFLLSLLVPFFCGIPRAISTLDFILRRHPAEPVVLSALRNRTAVDPNAAAKALTPSADDLDSIGPAFRSENQTARARALKEKLDADAALAGAIEQRERSRAALMRAQREVREARRKGGR